MNIETNKKEGRFMAKKYKEIYDDKFLESIPKEYREAFENLELSDYSSMIDIDKVLEVFGIKMKWLIIDVPEIFEDKNKTILFGNSTQEREVRRFNQAKGIGYSFIKNRGLSGVNPKHREIFNGIDNKFAEQFAKDLLMPEKLLIETIEGAAKFRQTELKNISTNYVLHYVMDALKVSFGSLKEHVIDKGFLVEKEN